MALKEILNKSVLILGLSSFIYLNGCTEYKTNDPYKFIRNKSFFHRGVKSIDSNVHMDDDNIPDVFVTMNDGKGYFIKSSDFVKQMYNLDQNGNYIRNNKVEDPIWIWYTK